MSTIENVTFVNLTKITCLRLSITHFKQEMIWNIQKVFHSLMKVAMGDGPWAFVNVLTVHTKTQGFGNPSWIFLRTVFADSKLVGWGNVSLWPNIQLASLVCQVVNPASLGPYSCSKAHGVCKHHDKTLRWPPWRILWTYPNLEKLKLISIYHFYCE